MTEAVMKTEESPALSPEQQAALAAGKSAREVGEASGQTEQKKLYAGKYETVEEMEKALLDAQSKADVEQEKTDDTPEEKSEDSDDSFKADTDTYGAAVASALKEAGLKGADLSKEYEDNKGELSEETYASLEKAGYSRSTVQAYLRGIASGANEAQEIAEKAVVEIMDSVGGEAEYKSMVKWMTETLSETERTAFDNAVSLGSKEVAALVVSSMHSKYIESVGKEADPVEGKTTKTTNETYQSRAEMMRDMADPRYQTDPAFREGVARKVAASRLYERK